MVAVFFYLYFSWTFMILLFNVSVKMQLPSAFIQYSSPVMNISVGLSFFNQYYFGTHTQKSRLKLLFIQSVFVWDDIPHWFCLHLFLFWDRVSHRSHWSRICYAYEAGLELLIPLLLLPTQAYVFLSLLHSTGPSSVPYFYIQNTFIFLNKHTIFCYYLIKFCFRIPSFNLVLDWYLLWVQNFMWIAICSQTVLPV